MDRPFRRRPGLSKEMSAQAGARFFGATQQQRVPASCWLVELGRVFYKAKPSRASTRRHNAAATKKVLMDARSAQSEKPLTHQETRRIVWGVLLPLFMGS